MSVVMVVVLLIVVFSVLDATEVDHKWYSAADGHTGEDDDNDDCDSESSCFHESFAVVFGAADSVKAAVVCAVGYVGGAGLTWLSV